MGLEKDSLKQPIFIGLIFGEYTQKENAHQKVCVFFLEKQGRTDLNHLLPYGSLKSVIDKQ